MNAMDETYYVYTATIIDTNTKNKREATFAIPLSVLVDYPITSNYDMEAFKTAVSYVFDICSSMDAVYEIKLITCCSGFELICRSNMEIENKTSLCTFDIFNLPITNSNK